MLVDSIWSAKVSGIQTQKYKMIPFNIFNENLQ